MTLAPSAPVGSTRIVGAMTQPNSPQLDVSPGPALEPADVRYARLWECDDVLWYLGISLSHLKQLRADRAAAFPPPLALPGRLIRWQPCAVVAWATGEPVTPAPVHSPRKRPGRKPKQ
jgi:predicted DNA-binding transcriptional regulator AlpA